MAFLGQGVLWVLAGSRREENLIYRFFRTLTSPVNKLARFVMPRFVLDQHIGLVGFLLVVVLWVVLTAYKIRTCSELGYPRFAVPGC